MAENPSIPIELQPRQKDLGFDLDRALAGIVGVKARVPDDAFTARTLGTERQGHGIVLRQSGLVLTMGYLVVEAESVWLRTVDGRVIEGQALAYDQETGFGLVQALGSLDVPTLRIGSAKNIEPGDRIIVAGAGGREMALSAQLVGKQEFAGYWEYYLSEALFTAPAHPFWGGAAALDETGALIGVASLQVQHGQSGKRGGDNLNMIVPIDILPPVLDDLVKYGRPNRPARPWLGFYATELGDRVVVAGVAEGGPAESAGMETGDIVLAVADERPKSLGDLWKRIWALGNAGVEAPLLVERDNRILAIKIASVDRLLFTRTPVLH